MDDDKPAPTHGVDDPLAHPEDAGAYVGRLPERQAETIPGGVRNDDERIAAGSSSVGPIREDGDPPDRREAGESH